MSQRGVALHGSFKGWWCRGGGMETEPDPELESARHCAPNMGFGISVQLSPVPLPGKVATWGQWGQLRMAGDDGEDDGDSWE